MEKVSYETGRLLSIGVCNRYANSVNRIKKMIADGMLGEIYHVYASFRAYRSIPGLGGDFTTKAVSGGWDGADIDKIKEGLNQKVQAGMINISMNTAPKFENGSAEGNLMIVNETINNYPQIVIIMECYHKSRIDKLTQAVFVRYIPHDISQR